MLAYITWVIGWSRDITAAGRAYRTWQHVFLPSHLFIYLCVPIVNFLGPVSVLQQYVVSIDGNDPFIKWQMERGLDWTISSVAGESYRVDVSVTSYSFSHVHVVQCIFVIVCWLISGDSLCQIDLTEMLESWAAENIHMETDQIIKMKPVWRDTSFTLKYYSDALFDFPHWFGFSKRKFKVSVSYSCYWFVYL